MSSLRRGLVGWLLLALLWAPTLGLLHRHVHVVHGTGPATAEVAQAGHGYVASPVDASPQIRAAPLEATLPWISGLFAGHGEAAECLLYDQCNVADTLVCAPLLLPAALPVFLLHLFQGEAHARWVALYNARGPPPVR